MGKGLDIMFWNVRSLPNKLDTIIHETNNIKPDVMNISESWLHPNIDDSEVSIQGYNLVRQDRGFHNDGKIKRGGGLCTYLKFAIIFEVITNLQYCDIDIEMLVIKVKLPFTRDIYVLNVYRPPSGNLENCIKI